MSLVKAREIFTRRAASKNGHPKTVSWKRRREANEVSMKFTLKLRQLALAFLFAATIATAQARAQKHAEGKIILPPAPPPPIAQASPLPPPTTLPVKPVADKLAPTGWTRYEVGEPALFSLILPAVPEASAERMNVIPGVSVTVRVYLSATDSGVYGATYVEGLPAASMSDAMKQAFFESFITSFMDGFEKSAQSRGVVTSLRRLEQRTATAGGLSGYEQDFSYDKLLGRVRLVFDGRRAYAVLSVWNGLSSNSERNAFFESLRITKSP